MFFYFVLSETYRIINVTASASNLPEIHPYLMIYALSQHRRLRSRLFGISSADRRARAQFRKLDDLSQRRQAPQASELSDVGKSPGNLKVVAEVCGYRSPVHPCGRWSPPRFTPSVFSHLLVPHSRPHPQPALILIPSSYTEFT